MYNTPVFFTEVSTLVSTIDFTVMETARKGSTRSQQQQHVVYRMHICCLWHLMARCWRQKKDDLFVRYALCDFLISTNRDL